MDHIQVQSEETPSILKLEETQIIMKFVSIK